MCNNINEIPQSIQDYSDSCFDYSEASDDCLIPVENLLSEDEMEETQ